MGKKTNRKTKSRNTKHRNADWRFVERVVALIEKSIAPDAKVRHDVQLPEVITGNLRQCDIVIEQGTQPRQTVTIVEVQKRKSRVKIGDLDGWWQKMHAVGAQHLICVSLHEFPKSVKEKVAKSFGPSVRLVQLRELSNKEFPIGVTSIPFHVPTARLDPSRRVQFDLEEPHDWKDDIKANANDQIFQRETDGRELSIINMIHEATEEYSRPLRIPPGQHHGYFQLKGTENFWIRNKGNRYRVVRLLIPAIVDVAEREIPIMISSYDQVGYEQTLAWLAEATGKIDGEEYGFRLTFVPDTGGKFLLRAIEQTGAAKGGFLVFQGRFTNSEALN